MIKVAKITLLFIVLLIGGVALSLQVFKVTSERRIRTYFGIDASQLVNTRTLQSAIASRVPPGSSVNAVHSYLEQAGIGKDEFSGYGDSLVSEKPLIWAQVGHGFGLFCNNEFAITFQFADAPLGRDAMNQVIVLNHEDILKEVQVKESWTCL